jgi:hypothetical protein
MVDRVTVTSFQYSRLAETRAYAPELPTGGLVSEVSDETIVQAQALGLGHIFGGRVAHGDDVGGAAHLPILQLWKRSWMWAGCDDSIPSRADTSRT